MKVFKFILPSTGANSVYTHLNAKFLRCGLQGYDLVVWALVDENEPLSWHHLEVIGTGWDFDTDKVVKYIDTVTDPQGFVWHTFQIHD